jgi:poly(A) polymerase
MAIFGRGPGPWLRPVKDHLLGLVIDGQLANDDKAGAEAEARRFLAEHDAQSGDGVTSTTPDEPAPSARS